MALRSLFDLPAPAKLNLFLHVVGRREDGYHLLQSIFVLIDWADTLHVERREDGRLARHDLGPALPADDLSLKAARALQQASGTAFGVDISVLKRVPWGAGMGGGSSDAATVLLALNRLWNLHWPRERLAALGLGLGADVPFFIGGDNAFVEGVGDRLSPLDWPERRYAVVKPAEAVATARIFGHPQLARNSRPATMEGSLAAMRAGFSPGADRLPTAGSAARPAGSQAGVFTNDLQPVAEQLCPAVAQVARWLEDRFGNSRMTGSGSAVFSDLGEVPRPETAGETGAHAPDAATVVSLDMPAGWIGRLCTSLPRHPLRDWAA